MLLVEQNAEMALQLADRVYIIDHGTVVFEGAPARLRADTNVMATYLGRASRVSKWGERRQCEAGPVLNLRQCGSAPAP